MGASIQDRLMDEREKRRDEGEPLLTEEVAVGNANGDGTLQHSIPLAARNILDLCDEDNVELHIYEDGYWVEPVDEEQ